MKVNPYCDDSPESKYSKLLTAYAADDKVHEIKEDNGQYTVEISEGIKVVTLSSCGCVLTHQCSGADPEILQGGWLGKVHARKI